MVYSPLKSRRLSSAKTVGGSTLTTIIEDAEGRPKAKLHWGPAEIAAVVSILSGVLAGGAIAIRVAIAQDRTERMAIEAKTIAERASLQANGVDLRLSRIEEKVERVRIIEDKLDRVLEKAAHAR
jgi:hypothetical protein